MKTISHLDLMRFFDRALRRSGLPLRMSEGFNPKLKISFPAALGVGIEGAEEVMEFELVEWVVPQEIEHKLRKQLPSGLNLLKTELGRPTEAARAQEVTYLITLRETWRSDPRLASQALGEFMNCGEILARRHRKGREKVVDIRPLILALCREKEGLILRLKAGPEGSARPEEVLEAMGFDKTSCLADFQYARTRVELAN